MLTNAAGPTTVVGLGIGVPTTGIAKCALSTAIKTASGSTPQISAAVDPGQYCVTVYDLSTLTARSTSASRWCIHSPSGIG